MRQKPAHNFRLEGVFERQKRYPHTPDPNPVHTFSLEGAFLNKDILPPTYSTTERVFMELYGPFTSIIRNYSGNF